MYNYFSVLLAVAGDARRGELLRALGEDGGFSVLACVSEPSRALELTLSLGPDALVLDRALCSPGWLARRLPISARPVTVLLTDREAAASKRAAYLPWSCAGRLPELLRLCLPSGDSRASALRREISRLLRDLKFPMSRPGSRYIAAALYILASDPDIATADRDMLYPLLSGTFDVDPAEIDRQLADAANQVWHTSRGYPGPELPLLPAEQDPTVLIHALFGILYRRLGREVWQF